ncbi:LysR family transcriptional regulator [Lysinibacillus yapensis]|uniref:LysR family transcriptional regulator n=1 Tax=Ureibacillus yapensis TaxID=2304605 RepID=UPI0011C3DF8B|nr:LysR family transcriptional regulator [Lysinibacillus yapensis]
MNIDQLEAFIHIVQLKSVHKASKALFLSQPTVTARIKSLENELNTELFSREGKNLILSQQGKEFIPYAQQILQAYRDGKKQLSKESAQNEIVFAANTITSHYFISYALSKWKIQNPGLRFKFISSSTDDLISKLLNHEVDFAFIRLMSNEGIHQEALLDNSVHLFVYPGHPLINLEEITVNELANEPLVFFECGAFDWGLIYKLFEVQQVEPKIEFRVDDLEVAKSLIKNKQCIGFLPSLAVKKELEKGELIEIDTTTLISIKQHIYLSYIKNERVNLLKDCIYKSAEHFYN